MTSHILAGLLNQLVPGLLLTAIVWLSLRIIPRSAMNAATRYAFWWIALAAVVALPFLQWSRPRPAQLLPMRSTQTLTPPRGVALPAQSAPENGHATSVASAPVVIHSAPGRWPDRLIQIWLLVAALMLIRLIASYYLLLRIKARATPISSGTTFCLDEWLSRCGSPRKRVRLLASGEISTPMVAGPWQAAILIPAPMFESFDPEDLNRIGLHEAAHLARNDDYALLVQRFLEALFFFHPAVRCITRQIHLEREIACDDYVVETTGLSRNYAACLTRVAEIAIGARPSPLAAAVVEERSHLARRVSLLLDRTRNTGTRLLKTYVTAAAALLLAAAYTLAHVPQLIAFSAQVETPAATTPWFVPVTVQDEDGRFVTGLQKQHFRLFEDGVEQQISRVSEYGPVSIGILVDTSVSLIDPNLTQTRQAIQRLLDASTSEDEFFLTEAGDSARVLHEFTTRKDDIRDRLSSIAPSTSLAEWGGPAVLDGLTLAATEMKKARNERRILWVIWHGGNYDRPGARNDLIAQIQRSGVQIGLIRFHDAPTGSFVKLPPDDIDVTGPDVEVLRDAPDTRITESESHAVAVGPLSELPIAAADVSTAWRAEYRLEYTPTNTKRDSGRRNVEVRLIAPRALPPLTAWYPKSYYAPLSCEHCPNLPANW